MLEKSQHEGKKIDGAVALYEEAAACEPMDAMDAMERMDVEMAKEELED